ncbi:MAG TPA: type II toxin-antitoxin system prevent-host-death family antitoxin [Polyangiaceae bacterium]|jgi:prevent-host-death family protein|nr:type II toxin-antitoxin system prevent-host-death family antitoxin [Polyangiaceae bacterium]
MASVPVTELKAHLAKFLRMAQRGIEVLVLDRGVPIARLVPISKSDAAEPAALDRLVSAGIVRRGEGGMRSIVKRRLEATANIGRALDVDREDRT